MKYSSERKRARIPSGKAGAEGGGMGAVADFAAGCGPVNYLLFLDSFCSLASRTSLMLLLLGKMLSSVTPSSP